MTAAKPEVSVRARAIIEGLVRTGRGSKPRLADAHVQLRAEAAASTSSCSMAHGLLRGDTFDEAEELQAKFAEAMARAGERPGR
jgi:hypothetical protein